MPEIQFSLRDFFHPLGIFELARAFGRNERLASHRVEEYQMERLGRVLEVASRDVPYYRDVFRARGLTVRDFRTPRDLAKLPILNKDKVRSLGEVLLRPGVRTRVSTTSGTTSEPLAIHLDGNAAALEFVYYLRHWGWASYRLGDRFAQLNAQEFHDRSGPSLARVEPLTGRLLLDSSALSEEHLAAMVARIRDHRPRFLKGLASPLYFLALLLDERGIRDVSFRAVFSTGEMLVPARRRLIERVFGCRVLDSYGMLEQAAAICECPEGGLHVRSDYALVELHPLDRGTNGARHAAIVGTTLHNLAMPLLRYETGDEVELAPEGARCACGRTLPLVQAIHGRTEDAVVTPDGRYVTTLFLAREHVEAAEVAQFIQEDERTLVVRVVPGKAFGAAEHSRLLDETRRLVGGSMRVELVLVDRDGIERGPTGKVPLVLSRVARARATRDRDLPGGSQGRLG